MKAEQAGVETGSKIIAVRDRYRTDLVCRVENMSSCMPNIKGMVTPYIKVNGILFLGTVYFMSNISFILY